jgi:hypothetical protein
MAGERGDAHGCAGAEYGDFYGCSRHFLMRLYPFT